MEPDGDTPALAFAGDYPFDIPPCSFLYGGGRAEALVPGDGGAAAVDWAGAGKKPGAVDWAGRVAVIACGSNRSPRQLARKFAPGIARKFAPGIAPGTARPDAGVIPVIRARVDDFDVVYSAHFTSYGAVPATLCPSPGTRAEVSVLWLTAAQLARMHGTESLGLNYGFGRLSGLRLEMEIAVEGARVLAEAFHYAGLHGCLAADSHPLSLAAVAARGRAFPARHQIEVLRLARDRLAPGRGLEAFVTDVVGDHALRRRYVRRLARDACLLDPPGFEAIAV